MKVSAASLRVIATATCAPDPGSANETGSIKIGRDITKSLADPVTVWGARIFIPPHATLANAVEITLADGTIATLLDGSPQALGTAQVESQGVTANAGATANGNLTVTLTSASVDGSPLAVLVPLRSSVHTTAALIATAIAEKLAATAAVATAFDVTSNGDDVVLTQRFADGNDGTLNLAITAGLGVSVNATSSNTTTGVAGILIERLGGDGNDPFGATLVTPAAYSALVLSVADGNDIGGITVNTDHATILSGGIYALSKFSDPATLLLETVSIAEKSIIDIVFISE